MQVLKVKVCYMTKTKTSLKSKGWSLFCLLIHSQQQNALLISQKHDNKGMLLETSKYIAIYYVWTGVLDQENNIIQKRH